MMSNFAYSGVSPEEQEEMEALQAIQAGPPPGVRAGLQSFQPQGAPDLAGNPHGGGILDGQYSHPYVDAAYERRGAMEQTLDDRLASQPAPDRETGLWKNVLKEGIGPILMGVGLGGAAIPMALAYAIGAGQKRTDMNKEANAADALGVDQDRYTLADEGLQRAVEAYGGANATHLPAGVREFEHMTQGMSPEDKEKARKIHLGLLGRASNAGFQFGTVTGSDGRKREVVRDPRTGTFHFPNPFSGQFEQVEADPGSFRPTADVGAGAPGYAPSQGQGAPIAPQPGAGTAPQPIAPPGGSPGPSVVDPYTSRRPEDESRAVAENTPQPGMRMVPGEDGQPAMVPIPGSEVDYTRAEDEAKAREKAEITGTAAQTVWEDIELAGGILDEYGHLATGIAGPISGWLPLTPANRLKQRIESIQGNVAVDQLLKIKASGAGLGHIPQAQLEMLASLLGKLNTELSPQDLRYNLRRIQEIYADIVKKNGGRNPVEIYEGRLSTADQTGTDRASPQAQPAQDNLNLSPAARAFLEEAE